MFKDLDENLSSIEEEVSKLKNAVAHIEKSKESAESSIKAAELLTKEFSTYIKKVTSEVDKIFIPHVELIEATEKLKKLLIAVLVVGSLSILFSIIQILLKLLN